MSRPCPRMVIGALRGSAGKTTLCTAAAAALALRGVTVAPFKKGPDYIDAAWLALAAGRECRNLDTFLMGREQVVRSFSRHAPADAVSLVEGNRGLYDGSNPEGEHSTAELAKLLKAPVILVVDCDKVTRTMAAMVLGCQHFDRAVDIRGVILNRVAGKRHAAIVRRTVEEYCGLRVFGTVPRMADMPFSERHLGLIPPQEQERVRHTLERAAGIAADCLDLEGLVETARNASALEDLPEREGMQAGRASGAGLTIGIIRDRAFQFYYPENIEALVEQGARVLEVSALGDSSLPPVDALYIGGGFPETQAEFLARNESFRHSLRRAAEEGLPVYAECGGFMYLGRTLIAGDRQYPMAGFFPVDFKMEKRPQGHGYTVADVEGENPFFPVGTRLAGHEFHYSRALSRSPSEGNLAFRMRRGEGIDGRRDGLCRKSVLATFTHLHALGTPQWADGLIARARQHRDGGKGITEDAKNSDRDSNHGRRFQACPR